MVFLTIGGSDPSGGAGIQADIKTAERLGLYPCSVITAITAQNTQTVSNIWPVTDKQLKAQLKAVLSDFKPDAVKIGLLASESQIEILSEVIEDYELKNVVLDPVLSPTLSSGRKDSRFVRKLVSLLFPLADVVTPNLPELSELEMAAGASIDNFCKAYLLTGGHSDGKEVTDSLFFRNLSEEDGEFQPDSDIYDPESSLNQIATSSPFPTMEPHPLASLAQPANSLSLPPMECIQFSHPRIETTNTHGSGCVLSSALACFLAIDESLTVATQKALDFTANALAQSASFKLSKGSYGPTLI